MTTDPTLFDLSLNSATEISDAGNVEAYGQYMTKRWAAERLLEHIGMPKAGEVVLEPSCGTGAWLHAVPSDVEAIGVEIDPALAAIAATDTGRRIIVGDFTEVEIDFDPSLIVGNPNFTSAIIEAFIRRTATLLPAAGRAAFILPCHSFSFASRTLSLLGGFETKIDLLPRDLYPRISFPLMLAQFKKSVETRLIGFVLFEEAAAIRSMRAEYRQIAENGRRPIWGEILECALRALGGEGTLAEIYDVVEKFRPTANAFWRDALRREAGTLCKRGRCERSAPGVFRLAAQLAA